MDYLLKKNKLTKDMFTSCYLILNYVFSNGLHGAESS